MDRTEYLRQYYLKNKDKIREYFNVWQSQNRDKVSLYQARCYRKHIQKRKEKSRRYYQENMDKAKAASAKWRVNNIDRVNSRYAEWKAENREKFLERKRAARLALYGLTQEAFNEMLQRQNGVCAVCRNPAGKRRLHVDHDHQSKKVRAILCTRCNCAIGLAKESPKILRDLAEYLEYHRDHSVCPVRGKSSLIERGFKSEGLSVPE